MLSRWPIRYKLQLGIIMLSLIVVVLSVSGFRGVYSYRQLARAISERAAELPKSAALQHDVEALRSTLIEADHWSDYSIASPYNDHNEFNIKLSLVTSSLEDYKESLEMNNGYASQIGDLRNERETVRKIEQTLEEIDRLNSDQDWVLQQKATIDLLMPKLALLSQLTSELPSYLHKRMQTLQSDVRVEYRTCIIVTWFCSIAAIFLLVMLVAFFHAWIFRPLNILIEGSRRVAADDFEYRMQLNTQDEMAELARAMNAMTARFLEIRDDLNHQVKQRTKEVVRSEQLASVGFLAAGVAHEINNPLASIAWAAEAIEPRIEEILSECTDSEQFDPHEIDVLRKYLRRIQDEAFRCKGITEQLLDFSRLGHVERQPTDLRDLIQNVVEMVQHLGKYRDKQISFSCDQTVIASLNPQEMKQVVLNLLTNALDSVDDQGRVEISLSAHHGSAEIVVIDNGCGMTEEVKEHLFEPFFTRRLDGSGTGLGLSITYRIIQDHGGTIEPFSEGPGCGAQFRVVLPLVRNEKKSERRYQAA